MDKKQIIDEMLTAVRNELVYEKVLFVASAEYAKQARNGSDIEKILCKADFRAGAMRLLNKLEKENNNESNP
jgi:hypothetical protein